MYSKPSINQLARLCNENQINIIENIVLTPARDEVEIAVENMLRQNLLEENDNILGDELNFEYLINAEQEVPINQPNIPLQDEIPVQNEIPVQDEIPLPDEEERLVLNDADDFMEILDEDAERRIFLDLELENNLQEIRIRRVEMQRRLVDHENIITNIRELLMNLDQREQSLLDNHRAIIETDRLLAIINGDI